MPFQPSSIVPPTIPDDAVNEEYDARYRHLVESASDGIYRIDVQGVFRYANPVIARVLHADGVVGRHYLEFVRDDFHEDIQRFYFRQIVDRLPVTYYEFPAVSGDGTEFWIGQRVQLETDPDGTVTGLHAVARDITDRKRLEDELRQSDKMRVVGQLAGGIAHDFNSLLTAICGFADLLIAALGPSDERTRDAIEIRKAADKAARLTSQLLTFSRRDTFRPRRLNVNAVVDEIRPIVTQLLGTHVQLETRLDEDVAEVHADPGQIEQVLLNLALNARDAMPHGGQFTIRTENTYIGAGSTFANTLYPGPYVVMSVTDTGIGMTNEVRAKIFEPFFTTKGPGEGTGLGLSTAYAIVTQSGGWINVESTVDAGTTFSVYLPQATTPSYTEPPRQLPIVSHRKGVVLVADDEEGVRAVLTRVLEAHGYFVIGASNGLDALEKARQHKGKIDLLLTDLVMPQMGGFELAEQFTSERPSSRVLFMSGYIDEERLTPIATQSVKLLYKPFDSETMLAEIRSIVPSSS